MNVHVQDHELQNEPKKIYMSKLLDLLQKQDFTQTTISQIQGRLAGDSTSTVTTVPSTIPVSEYLKARQTLPDTVNKVLSTMNIEPAVVPVKPAVVPVKPAVVPVEAASPQKEESTKTTVKILPESNLEVKVKEEMREESPVIEIPPTVKTHLRWDYIAYAIVAFVVILTIIYIVTKPKEDNGNVDAPVEYNNNNDVVQLKNTLSFQPQPDQTGIQKHLNIAFFGSEHATDFQEVTFNDIENSETYVYELKNIEDKTLPHGRSYVVNIVQNGTNYNTIINKDTEVHIYKDKVEYR